MMTSAQSPGSRGSFASAGFHPHLVRIPASADDPELNDLEIYALRRKAGSKNATKEPILLLHGHPQNLLIWHRVVKRLIDAMSQAPDADRDIVVADLRGHGHSGVPRVRNFVRQGHDGKDALPRSSAAGGAIAPSEEGSPSGLPSEEALRSRYSKRAMGRDMIFLMKQFGYDRFAVVGHDRGGRVAHRMAIDHADVVTRVMTLDIVPTYDLYEKATSTFATAYWHWYFLIQPYPTPEEMILGAPQAYLDKMTGRSLGQAVGTQDGEPLFPPDVKQSYLGQLSSPPRVHATCEDYRCSAPGGIDLEHDAEDRQQSNKMRQPLRVLWGARNLNQLLFGEKGCIDLWRNVCAGEVSGRSYDCGHYMPEEIPAEIVQEIISFF